MENIKDTQEPTSYFCECVKAIQQAERESARQIREGFARLGLQIAPEPDSTKPITLRERLGLK